MRRDLVRINAPPGLRRRLRAVEAPPEQLEAARWESAVAGAKEKKARSLGEREEAKIAMTIFKGERPSGFFRDIRGGSASRLFSGDPRDEQANREEAGTSGRRKRSRSSADPEARMIAGGSGHRASGVVHRAGAEGPPPGRWTAHACRSASRGGYVRSTLAQPVGIGSEHLGRKSHAIQGLAPVATEEPRTDEGLGAGDLSDHQPRRPSPGTRLPQRLPRSSRGPPGPRRERASRSPGAGIDHLGGRVVQERDPPERDDPLVQGSAWQGLLLISSISKHCLIS
jgi:hypothetical protein